MQSHFRDDAGAKRIVNVRFTERAYHFAIEAGDLISFTQAIQRTAEAQQLSVYACLLWIYKPLFRDTVQYFS